MKLYLISQSENNDYDTYDSAVVCAPNEATARSITPGYGFGSSWCSSPQAVKVEFIGDASCDVKEGVVLASFNAG